MRHLGAMIAPNVSALWLFAAAEVRSLSSDL
jgi:hypothetical protein